MILALKNKTYVKNRYKFSDCSIYLATILWFAFILT